jgi:hypothetical protein
VTITHPLSPAVTATAVATATEVTAAEVSAAAKHVTTSTPEVTT